MVEQSAPRTDDPGLGSRLSALTEPVDRCEFVGLVAASVPSGLADGTSVALQPVGPVWHDGRVPRAAHASPPRAKRQLERWEMSDERSF